MRFLGFLGLLRLLRNNMGNPFEQLRVGAETKETPPAEKIKEREPDFESQESEKDREFSELALAARKEAESILAEAGMTKNIAERLEKEKRAYTIFAALDALGVEIPGSIKRTTDNLVATKRIVGFSSKKSAEIFLQDSVGVPFEEAA